MCGEVRKLVNTADSARGGAWEARQSKVQNNLLRKEWMEHQTAHNYHTEYDWVRGWMFHYRPPYVVPQQLRDKDVLAWTRGAACTTIVCFHSDSVWLQQDDL